MATKEPLPPPYPYRRALRSTHRVLIKAGTSVVANNDGGPSLTRLGAIVKQVAEVSFLCAIILMEL
jgi:glutamate 5-kinase